MDYPNRAHTKIALFILAIVTGIGYWSIFTYKPSRPIECVVLTGEINPP